ncbi:hypothetical protein Hamer_G011091, partial [Homarus americanus]
MAACPSPPLDLTDGSWVLVNDDLGVVVCNDGFKLDKGFNYVNKINCVDEKWAGNYICEKDTSQRCEGESCWNSEQCIRQAPESTCVVYNESEMRQSSAHCMCSDLSFSPPDNCIPSGNWMVCVIDDAIHYVFYFPEIVCYCDTFMAACHSPFNDYRNSMSSTIYETPTSTTIANAKTSTNSEAPSLTTINITPTTTTTEASTPTTIIATPPPLPSTEASTSTTIEDSRTIIASPPPPPTTTTEASTPTPIEDPTTIIASPPPPPPPPTTTEASTPTTTEDPITIITSPPPTTTEASTTTTITTEAQTVTTTLPTSTRHTTTTTTTTASTEMTVTTNTAQ